MQQSIPDLISQVDDLLPQTQCERCGYKGCRPYAEAVVRNNEAINLCQPGGQATVDLIAEQLKLKPIPVKAQHQSQIAFIREDDCIGCTKCIQACPVDAIVGSSKQMHTIIESECTGCELCLPPCPTLCIELVPKVEPSFHPQEKISKERAQYLKARFISRKERLGKQLANKSKARQQKTQIDIKAEIQRSLSRVQAKRVQSDEC